MILSYWFTIYYFVLFCFCTYNNRRKQQQIIISKFQIDSKEIYQKTWESFLRQTSPSNASPISCFHIKFLFILFFHYLFCCFIIYFVITLFILLFRYFIVKGFFFFAFNFVFRALSGPSMSSECNAKCNSILYSIIYCRQLEGEILEGNRIGSSKHLPIHIPNNSNNRLSLAVSKPINLSYKQGNEAKKKEKRERDNPTNE